MVTAHELREIANKHEFHKLLSQLKAKAEEGLYSHEASKDFTGYWEREQLERLGFKLDDWANEDTLRISW